MPKVWSVPMLLLASGCGLFDPACASERGVDQAVIAILGEFDVDYGRRASAFLPRDLDPTCSQESVACVQNSSELIAALADQRAEIVLRDGTYDVGNIEVPYGVSIRSATLWGARLGGASYLHISGEGVLVDGIRFEIGASPTGGRLVSERYGSMRIESTRDVILSNNLFDRIGETSTVPGGTGIVVRVFNSDDVMIHDNVFRRSHAIAIKTDDLSIVTVRHNDFLDSVDFGGAGEVIQLGSAYSLGQGIPVFDDATYSEFAYNYVQNWNLERELVSIKSSHNRIHHNFFVDSGDALVVRMGNDNEIWANLLRGNNEDFPVRISGERNMIHGNVFCGRGYAVSLHTEQGRVDPPKDQVNTYWAAVDNTVSGNLYYGFDRIAHLNQGYVSDDHLLSNPRNNVFEGNVMFNATPVLPNDVGGLVVRENTFVKSRATCATLQ